MKKFCLRRIGVKKSASKDSIPGWPGCARPFENEFHFKMAGAILIARS
jgi:hypothetical protein